MERIAQDETTRDWWKLTDPMQNPLESRKKGEWWASMPELFSWAVGMPRSGRVFRFAYVASLASVPEILDQPKGLSDTGIDKISLYTKDRHIYAYLEHWGSGEWGARHPNWEGFLTQILTAASPEAACSGWRPMPEIFHTD